MQNVIASAIFATVVATPSAATAQMMGHDHGSMMQPKPVAAAAKAAVQAEGEVRRVDKAKGTVVLRHGPLEALGMPPMTMEFVAKDPKLLANLKQGDKVRFTPEQGKDGTLVVSAIEVVKG